MVGDILTALNFLVGDLGSIVNYMYLGFLGMMVINSIFPYLVSTIVLKKYSPGIITGLFLNLLFSLILMVEYCDYDDDFQSSSFPLKKNSSQYYYGLCFFKN